MPNPSFSADWFSHHIGFWVNTFKAAKWEANTRKTIVEIGSFEGRSTIWSCHNLLRHLESRIICIDTFEGSVEHSDKLRLNLFDRFKNNIESAGVADKVVIRRGESWRELARLVTEGVRPDFIYIDGSHQAPDVLADAILSYRLLTDCGLMIFDDYHWNIEPHGREDILNSPKLAVDLFINLFRRKTKLFAQSPHQIVLQKTEVSG